MLVAVFDTVIAPDSSLLLVRFSSVDPNTNSPFNDRPATTPPPLLMLCTRSPDERAPNVAIEPVFVISIEPDVSLPATFFEPRDKLPLDELITPPPLLIV